MIFSVLVFYFITASFRILPSKGNLPLGIIRLLPQTDAHWRLAQKTSGNWFFLWAYIGIDRLLFKDIWAYELFSD